MTKFNVGDKVRLKKAPNLIGYDNLTVGKIYEVEPLNTNQLYLKDLYIVISDDIGRKRTLVKEMFKELTPTKGRKRSVLTQVFRVQTAEQASHCLAELERYGFKKFNLTDDLDVDEIGYINVYYDGTYGLMNHRFTVDDDKKVSNFYTDSKLIWNFQTNCFDMVNVSKQVQIEPPRLDWNKLIKEYTDNFTIEPFSRKLNKDKPKDNRIMVNAEKLLEVITEERMDQYALKKYLRAYIDGQKGRLQ